MISDTFKAARADQSRALMLMALGTVIGLAVGLIAGITTDTYLFAWAGAGVGCITAIAIVEWTDWLPLRRSY